MAIVASESEKWSEKCQLLIHQLLLCGCTQREYQATIKHCSNNAGLSTTVQPRLAIIYHPLLTILNLQFMVMPTIQMF